MIPHLDIRAVESPSVTASVRPDAKDSTLTYTSLLQIAAGRALTGETPDDLNKDDFQCFTASLSKYVRRDTGLEKAVVGNWDCVLNSETGYLSRGAERGW